MLLSKIWGSQIKIRNHHEFPPLFGKWQEQLARPHLLWSGVCQRLDPGHGDWLTVTLGGCQGPRSLPASDWTSDTVSSLPLVSIIHSGSQTTEIKVLQTRKSEKEFTFSSLIKDQARRVGARLSASKNENQPWETSCLDCNGILRADRIISISLISYIWG